MNIIGTGRGHRLTDANAVMRPQRIPTGPHATSTVNVKAPRAGARRGYIPHETWLKQGGVDTALWNAVYAQHRAEKPQLLSLVVEAQLSLVDGKGKCVSTERFVGTNVRLYGETKKLRKRLRGQRLVVQILSVTEQMVTLKVHVKRRRGQGYVAVKGEPPRRAEAAKANIAASKKVWAVRKAERLLMQSHTHQANGSVARGERLGDLLAAAGIIAKGAKR